MELLVETDPDIGHTMFRMEVLFIDLENITTDTLSGWNIEWPIYLFHGITKEKMKIGLAQSLQPRGKKVSWIRMDGDGKNALDFHITFNLGQLSLQHPGAAFKILSKDKGFDPLVKHLKQMSIDCERIEKVPAKPAPKKTAPKQPASAKIRDRPTLLKGFADHIEGMAEEMIEFLRGQNRIQLEGEKIRYLAI